VSYQRLEDLKSYRIGYMFGGAATRVLEQAGLSIEYVNLHGQNIRKLYLERIDLLVMEDTGGWASIKEIYPEDVSSFDQTNKVILEVSVDVVFKKENDALLRQLQTGLEKIKMNGTYVEIVRRYYSHGTIPQNIIDYIN
jgi:ABC-type amino acid transport substrate-binding protein